MKYLLLCCLALPAALHAATLRVDNNESHPAEYRTIQEAVDAAEVGDTILVAGSNDPYAAFTLTKRLIIKGERPGPVNVGTTVVSATITELYDDISPDHLRNAGGSVIEGLEIQSVEVVGPLTGVIIRRCKTESLSLSGCSGTLIVSCFLDSCGVREWLRPGDGTTFTGTGNTVIGSRLGSVSVDQPTNTLLANCVIGTYVGSGSEVAGPISTWPWTTPFVIRNSILLGKETIFAFTDGNAANNAKAVFDHCLLLSGSTLPAGNGNINRAYNQFSTVFVDATPYSTDPDGFVLKAGSAAIGAGIGGVDLGMYGGASPFVKDFMPALPRINYLAVPPLVPDSTGLTFEVRAEARD